MRIPFPQPIIKLVAPDVFSISLVKHTILGDVTFHRMYVLHEGEIYTFVQWEDDEVALCRKCTVREHVDLMEYMRGVQAGKGGTESQEEEKGEGEE